MNPPRFDEFLFNELENCQGHMLRALISLNQTPASTPTTNLRQIRLARRSTIQDKGSFQSGSNGGTEVRGSFHGADAGSGHRRVFVFGGALAAADDGAGVAHAAA